MKGAIWATKKEMILMKFKINSVTNSANSEDDVEKFIKDSN